MSIKECYICSSLQCLNILNWNTFVQQRACFLSHEKSSWLTTSRIKPLFFSEKANREAIRSQQRCNTVLQLQVLAPGKLERDSKRNKPVIRTPYLQWPLSNSRCTHGVFPQLLRRGCLKKCQVCGVLHGATSSWTQKQRETEQKWKQHKKKQIFEIKT